MSHIPSLRQKRGQVVDQMEALINLSSGSGRGLTEEETTSYNALKSQAQGLKDQIARAEETEALKAETSVSVDQPVNRGTGVEVREPKRELGIAAARCIRAFAGAKKQGIQPHEYCERHIKDAQVTKALQASSAAGGGFTIPDEFAAELIEFLRPQSVVRRMGAVPLPLPKGNMTMPKQAAGASATYIGEGTNIANSEPTFGQLKLTARKLAALTPVSNDLMRFSSINVDMLVRNDLVAAIAQAEDLNFIRGDGSGAGPRGLRYWAPAANVLAVNATVNLANTDIDLSRLWQQLANANCRMQNLGWIFAPRTFSYLETLRDGNGNKAFPEVATGKLKGYPFAITTQIPINLAVTGTSESEIYLVDFADAIVADVPGLIVDASSEAAYHNGSAVVAAFSLDQTVVRIIAEHDFGMRHDASVAVLKDVDWGA